MSTLVNIEFYTITLWVAVVWPLLLSIPSLHNRLPWPRYLAIIPATVLAVIPVDASIDIPWLLFGTGFAIDENVRWILSTMVVIWFAAATLTLPSKQKNDLGHSSTLYHLTLTGSLGALLTTDLVAFFSFSTLMGYGFYGLLTQQGDKALQRASRLYLYCLIAADIALFEALLLVAFTTEYFQYEIVRQAMSELSASSIYVYMVLLGFILKAGIWPFYFWLSAAFNSASRSIALLLLASPIMISLIGLLRWLPVREDTVIIGMVMQVLGCVALLVAAFKIITAGSLIQHRIKQGMVRFITAWLVITFTGLFSLAIGTALVNPSLWQQYSTMVYPFIAVISLALTIVILKFGEAHSKSELTDTTPLFIKHLIDQVEKWINATILLATNMKLKSKVLWKQSGSFVIRQYQQVLNIQKSKFFVMDWKINIILFLIIGLVITLITK